MPLAPCVRFGLVRVRSCVFVCSALTVFLFGVADALCECVPACRFAACSVFSLVVPLCAFRPVFPVLCVPQRVVRGGLCAAASRLVSSVCVLLGGQVARLLRLARSPRGAGAACLRAVMTNFGMGVRCGCGRRRFLPALRRMEVPLGVISALACRAGDLSHR